MSPRASRFTLRVLTPERVVLETDAVAARIPVHDGSLGVLPNHAPLLAPVGIGILSYRTAAGQDGEIFVNEGFLEVAKNEVRVVADAGERSDEVDLARAKEAEARARARLGERLRVDMDLVRAERALLRSLVRQRLVERRARRA